MPKINITIDVTNDELELLKMGKADQPNSLRMKQYLLASARQALKNFADTVYNKSVRGRVRTVVWKDLQPDGNGGWLDDDNIRNLRARSIDSDSKLRKSIKDEGIS